jgi:hypothetical protein
LKVFQKLKVECRTFRIAIELDTPPKVEQLRLPSKFRLRRCTGQKLMPTAHDTGVLHSLKSSCCTGLVKHGAGVFEGAAIWFQCRDIAGRELDVGGETS